MESDKPGGVFAAIAPAVTAVTGETILDASSGVCAHVLSVGKANQITTHCTRFSHKITSI